MRVIGFDDAPFRRDATEVGIAGVVCSRTRFEGMVWGTAAKDGFDSTEVLASLLAGSKYAAQVNAVLLDGIAVGGLNVIDLPGLSERLELPCIAVMRKRPDLDAMRAAIGKLAGAEQRIDILDRAGAIHERPPFVYQVAGADADEAHRTLLAATDTGHVPEALRIAHMIGSAIVDGESRGRA